MLICCNSFRFGKKWVTYDADHKKSCVNMPEECMKKTTQKIRSSKYIFQLTGNGFMGTVYLKQIEIN